VKKKKEKEKKIGNYQIDQLKEKTNIDVSAAEFKIKHN